MSSETTENPVMLWGDMGPDVYKLSQIYNPHYDRFVPTADTEVAPDKEYYERLSLILTSDENVHEGRKYYYRQVNETTGSVRFIEVINASDAVGVSTPKQLGWYQDAGGKVLVFSLVDLSKYEDLSSINPHDQFWFEVNADPQLMCGKYVPAVDSLVMVDEVECGYKTDNNYRTRMLLVVKSVDRSLYCTFATVVFGSDTEETVRAIDYGNEKFMLFYDRKTGGTGNIKLTPDRKLLLYGKNSYGYRLIRDGSIISSNIPAIQVRDDAFIPYARSIGKRVSLTKENYDSLQKLFIDVVLPTGMQRLMQLPDAPETLIRTCDTTFRAGVKYFTEDGIEINTTGLVNKPVNPGQYSYEVGIVDDDGNQIQFDKFYTEVGSTSPVSGVFESGKTYYVIHNGRYAVADVTKLCGMNILDWEKNDERGRRVYRRVATDDRQLPANMWDGDLIGRTMYAHSNPEEACGSVFVPESCYLKSNMSMVEGEPITMEIFSFDYETGQAHMCMCLTLIAKEAAALDATDVTTRQIVGFDVELNGNDNCSDVWYLQQGDNWKTVFSMAPKIMLDDGSDITVPIDNKSCYAYGFEDIKSKLVGREYQVLFKYFPHKRLNLDWQKLGLTPTKNFITCRKTVKIINKLSNVIRKISLIPAWNQANQEYELYYLIFRTDFAEPPIIRHAINTKYKVETFKLTTDTRVSEDESGQQKPYFQKMNSGNFIEVSGLHLNDSIAGRGYYEKQLQPSATIYDVQYLNDNGDETYVAAAASGGLFDTLQRAILTEKVYTDNITATDVYTQGIAFKLQNMMLSDPTKVNNLPWLIGDDTIGWKSILPYGNSLDEYGGKRPYLLYTGNISKTIVVDGNPVEVEAGAYQVHRSAFLNAGTFLAAFYMAAQPPFGTSAEDVVLGSEQFRPNYFYLRACSDDSVASGFVRIPDDDADAGGSDEGELFGPTIMVGGGTAVDTIGGAAPSSNIRDTIGAGSGAEINLMGTVIMEFVRKYQDPEDASKEIIKHLYAVPVEVRDISWPAREA